MLTTPPAAAVGTVSVRSLIEPIRKVIARLRGHFLQAKAVDLVMSERLLEVETTAPDGTKSNIYLPYVACSILVPCLTNTQLRQTRYRCRLAPKFQSVLAAAFKLLLADALLLSNLPSQSLSTRPAHYMF